MSNPLSITTVNAKADIFLWLWFMMTASQQVTAQKTTLLYKRSLTSSFINSKDFKEKKNLKRVISSRKAPQFEDRIEIIYNICSVQAARNHSQYCFEVSGESFGRKHRRAHGPCSIWTVMKSNTWRSESERCLSKPALRNEKQSRPSLQKTVKIWC